MKKLFFAVSALAALSLLAPSAGFAQDALNQIGIYTDQTGDITTASITTPTNVPFNAYLVLTNPVNELGGSPVDMTSIYGFECQIVMPVAGLFTLASTYPEQALNVGTVPDYIIGYNVPVPTSANPNRSTVLMSFQFMAVLDTPLEIFLAPSSAPSIPGLMAIADGDDLTQLQACYPSSGDFANAVFGVNTAVVATETESWGHVKSLFR